MHLFKPCLIRLDYQPLFGKGARAPPTKTRLDSPVLLGKGTKTDTRERWKSSLCINKFAKDLDVNIFLAQISPEPSVLSLVEAVKDHKF